ncbi:FUSC family membrane protein [Ramlibacter tataouinensis]|uniref:FUSC family protein n=1 Tax=Ramlibacter tataouinensis TaxID=94132 RepID=UPI0022F3E29C|nr:FUSC family membrane protein [Ramlibacter tataouinensis]WBY01976.1 FUSC family membrane protein [Ramlibacter tataouinensis]
MPNALRIALGHSVLGGVSAALGLFFVATFVRAGWGAWPASVATVGVIVCIPPDVAAPLRGKLLQVLPAALFGVPLFIAMQLLMGDPVALGLLLVPATFLAFLAGAWGRRGVPIVASIMFAAIFSMAVPTVGGRDAALEAGGWFALGAALYLGWSVLANAVLNGRYRVQLIAETLQAVAALARTQASQFSVTGEPAAGAPPLIGRLMRQQAALADQLQAARNLVLEKPRTARRQQLAAMLLQLLEMRDHLLACELDLETLQAHPGPLPALDALRAWLERLAAALETCADALLLGRRPDPFEPQAAPAVGPFGERSAGVDARDERAMALVQSLSNRIAYLQEDTRQLVALARGDAVADVAVVREAWRLFVSPTSWSWKPFAGLWRWDAPPLRHAIRASLAIATAYALSLALPWGSHGYWLLLTIVVVLRGSLAQTVERRNGRVAGTLLGCLLAAGLLWLQLPFWATVLVLTVAQAVAHAFVVRNYVATAVAATVLGLLQASLLSAGADPVFNVAERLADTVLGAAIAWTFSYVLPSWERGQLPALLRRTLAAQARHARVALGLGQFDAVDDEPELDWRLARREAYDSLSALVQATQRALSEPRAVRPPLQQLERLLAHSYQLLAQLTAIKTLLLLRRERLDRERLRPELAGAAEAIADALLAPQGAAANGEVPPELPEPPPVPAGHDDLTPWALRRLALAGRAACQVRSGADAIRQAVRGRLSSSP